MDRHLYYNGDYVGRIEHYDSDMWYMDGVWVPAEGEVAERFTGELAAGDLREKYMKLEGLLIKYAEQEGGHLMDGIAIGMFDGRALIRMLRPESVGS